MHLLLILKNVEAECPDLKNIETMSGSKSTCAKFWLGQGNEDSQNSCRGKSVLISNLTNKDTQQGMAIPIGSIAVKSGCTVNLWEKSSFTGKRYHILQNPGLLFFSLHLILRREFLVETFNLFVTCMKQFAAV